MIRTLRRRRTFASAILGGWVLSLCIAIAHACGFDGARGLPLDLAATRIHQTGSDDGLHRHSDDNVPSACAKFYLDELPLLAKIRPVQDPPAGQPLVLPAWLDSAFATAATPVFRPVLQAHADSCVPLTIRFVRLTL